MTTEQPHAFRVQVGDHVVLADGDAEIGAVRAVAHDHVVIYIEGAGDFTIKGNAVRASHAGKLVLDPANLEPRLLEAARKAHDSEDS
jgi:hypothetical protein